MTLERRRFRDKLLEGSARPSECQFVGNEPRNFHGEREPSGRRGAPFRVRGWRVGTIEGRVDLRAVKQPGVALEMRSCSWAAMCGHSRNRPSRGPDVNASSHSDKKRRAVALGASIAWQRRAQQLVYSELTSRIDGVFPGDAVPGVPHRILHLLPGRRSSVLIPVPVPFEVALDVIPFAVSIAVCSLIAVTVAWLVVVVLPTFR